MSISYRIRTLLALLAVLTLLAACGDNGGGAAQDGGDAAEGTEGADGAEGGEPIVLGGLFDLTGATGDVGTPYSEGVRNYIDWRNEQGGVGGRPLDLRWQDYQYDVAIAEQLYSQHVSEGAVGVIGWGTGDTEALRGRIAQDEVPFLSASLSEDLTNPEESPYNFVVATTYSDQMRIALDFIAEQDPGAAVAVFHHDSPFGTSPVPDGEEYIEQAGLELSGYRSYAMPAGATTYSSELRQALDQGAQWIVINNVASPCAQLISNIQEQNLDLDGIIGLNWCTSEITIELAGDAAEGVYGVNPYVPPTGEAEGLEPLREYLESKDESLEDKGVHYVQGWWTTHVLVEAIARVVESGEEVTGPNIKAALEGNTFDTGGVTPVVEFSEESHRGVDAATIWVVKDGQWVEVEAERELSASTNDAVDGPLRMTTTTSSQGRRAGTPAGPPLLELNNIEVIYDEVILVLRGLSMAVAEGSIVALLGSNGAGKSTTLKAISGLLPSEDGEVSDGDVLYEGRAITHHDPAGIVKAGICQVMEGRRVFEHLTVHENLLAGAYTRRGRWQIGEEVDRVYGYFPRLKDRRNQMSGYLSGGEQQMLAIGRALMAKPRLLMLDEPSLGLAPLLVEEIFGIVERLNADLGTTVLLVEQNASRALAIAEHGYIMEQGRIVLEGSAKDLATNPDVQEFYLGLTEGGGRKSYRDIKHYKRRKRWL